MFSHAVLRFPFARLINGGSGHRAGIAGKSAGGQPTTYRNVGFAASCPHHTWRTATV